MGGWAVGVEIQSASAVWPVHICDQLSLSYDAFLVAVTVPVRFDLVDLHRAISVKSCI